MSRVVSRRPANRPYIIQVSGWKLCIGIECASSGKAAEAGGQHVWQAGVPTRVCVALQLRVTHSHTVAHHTAGTSYKPGESSMCHMRLCVSWSSDTPSTPIYPSSDSLTRCVPPTSDNPSPHHTLSQLPAYQGRYLSHPHTAPATHTAPVRPTIPPGTSSASCCPTRTPTLSRDVPRLSPPTPCRAATIPR